MFQNSEREREFSFVSPGLYKMFQLLLLSLSLSPVFSFFVFFSNSMILCPPDWRHLPPLSFRLKTNIILYFFIFKKQSFFHFISTEGNNAIQEIRILYD